MRRRIRPGPLAAALALACAAAAPLRAQVVPQPVVPKPPPELRLPRAPQGDLVILSAKVVQDGTGAIVAVLVLRNVGQEPMTIPRGTVIARGETQGGSITFPARAVPEGLSLFPGSETSVSLPSSGWCPSGKPGAVTFRVNPDNVLPESDTRNNTVSVPASAYTGDIASVQVWLESQRFPENAMTHLIDPAQRNTLPRGAGANIVVAFQNPGPGVVVVCQGAPLVREVQSPISAMFGLRTFNAPAAAIVRPGASAQIKLSGAVPPIVLDPGSYTWQLVLNPGAVVAESSAANNAASATVKVTPPVP